jgi:hypothetical protein
MNKLPLETTGEDSEIRFRDCLSVRYIQAAALLCRLGYAREKEFERNGELSQDEVLSHEAFILNSILSSVAFLESTINELYYDAADRAYLPADAQHAGLLLRIRERWNNEKNFDRAPVLTKYQKILAIAEKNPFSEEDPAFTNVRNLIAVRNFLLHYRREWVVLSKGRRNQSGNRSRSEQLETGLKHAFRENPLAGKNSPFFPDKCLGHGCAEWAVINTLVLADEFYSRLGIPAPYDGIRKELSTR